MFTTSLLWKVLCDHEHRKQTNHCFPLQNGMIYFTYYLLLWIGLSMLFVNRQLMWSTLKATSMDFDYKTAYIDIGPNFFYLISRIRIWFHHMATSKQTMKQSLDKMYSVWAHILKPTKAGLWCLDHIDKIHLNGLKLLALVEVWLLKKHQAVNTMQASTKWLVY